MIMSNRFANCVIATFNQGKLTEFKQLLHDVIPTITSLAEYCSEQADETAVTFIENAIIKARYACKQTGLPAIADDSGLEVDALNGGPGVHSARYGPTPEACISKLLDALADTPPSSRTARFRCVLAFLRHEDDPAPIICQGVWPGQIALQRQGEAGFGYDPIFYLPSLQCTAAELSASQKNQLSHRGQALQQLRQTLVSL